MCSSKGIEQNYPNDSHDHHDEIALYQGIIKKNA